jgi:hypothetical protein
MGDAYDDMEAMRPRTALETARMEVARQSGIIEGLIDWQVDCTECGGRGEIWEMDGTPNTDEHRYPCENCHETGLVDPRVATLTASLASAQERAEKAEAYKPCEPCLEGRHDDCTGDCSSNCCAFAVAQARVDFLEALLTREKLTEMMRELNQSALKDPHESLDYKAGYGMALGDLADAILRGAGK